MKQQTTLLLLIAMTGVFLTGCAALYEEYEPVSYDPAPQVRRFVSLYQLQRGLTKAEVKAMLGDEIITGYELVDRQEQRYKPLTMPNPYRVEEAQIKGKSAVVDYYFVGINASDGEIADDELSPLVFQDELLIGWGWDYLKRVKE